MDLYKEAATHPSFPSVQAMYNLATIYKARKNCGVQAFHWFAKAAAQTIDEVNSKDLEVHEAITNSNFVLGTIYQGLDDTKCGVGKDEKKALVCYKKAADWGDVKAQYNLATLLYSSDKIKDEKSAVEWYHKAAEGGTPGANFMLAQIYTEGRLVKMSLRKAAEYAKKAHAQGIQPAKLLYEDILKEQKILENARQRKIKEIEERVRELRVFEAEEEKEGGSKNIMLYKVAKAFRVSIRSKPTESPSTKTGKILEPGTIFRVKNIQKRKESDKQHKQTFLELFDGSGWAFVHYPKKGDKRVLVYKVLHPREE
uniref:Uncharacterized protein n=2 Tax=Amorphochlora amoebiformis TaxID=1561963 RepID=A0A7S0D401_9EUKA|mmetsp:Transcript_17590/g.28003  ORF Transcript_17590/g.28003 Transcript_17590/m.28003 type:complete len:312 (+) Transcript_17590:336-1271(+)